MEKKETEEKVKENQSLYLSDRNRRNKKYKPDEKNCEVYFLVLTEQSSVQSM